MDVSGRYVEHADNTLAYYLADRSLASSLSGDTREGLVNNIIDAYGGDPSIYSQPIIDPDGDGVFSYNRFRW